MMSWRAYTEGMVDHRGALRVLALGDPDPGVRALAERALDLPPGKAAWERLHGLPWAVLPREERDLRRLPSLGGLLYGRADPVAAMRALRAGVDPDDPRTALATLEVAERLQLELDAGHERRGDFEACSLALSLIDRFVAGGPRVLLSAAESLVAGPEVRLGAFERFTRARLDQVPSASLGPALGRERVLLSEPSYDELVVTLESIVARGARGVDLVLPPGSYRPSASGNPAFLDLSVSGLRIVGEAPGVHLFAGLRFENAEDVVIEGLSIENEAGLALIGLSSRITLRDCRISGTDLDANLQSCLLELDRVHITRASAAAKGAFSLRLSGESLLLARESLLEAGGLVLMGPETRVYLERCVVDGGSRNAIQAQHAGAIVLRDCLLRSQAAALYGAGDTLLEGVVVAAEGEVLQSCEGPVRYCPVHHGLTGRYADLSQAEPLPACPVEHGR
jgi:hypothetical protein